MMPQVHSIWNDVAPKGQVKKAASAWWFLSTNCAASDSSSLAMRETS